MKTKLAFRNLLHNKAKTSVAAAGVAFAIVLMFMQLGFLKAIETSATLIYEKLDFDVCIRSKDYLHLADARWISRTRLTQAAGAAGVRAVAPLTVTPGSWRNPRCVQRRVILCLAVDPAAATFLDPQIAAQVGESLDRPDALLIDAKTRREYGPRDGRRFGPADVRQPAELNGVDVEVAGVYVCGAGLSASGAAIVSQAGLARVNPAIGADRVSFGLVKLDDPEQADAVAARLAALLPADVDVLTRRRVLADEVLLWVYESNYGFIFQTGVVVSLIVGTAIVYQVLASDVASLLPEYATLKAMGYGNGYLARVILEQASALALLGLAAGVPLSALLYAITSAGAQIPVQMTLGNLCLVAALAQAMCVLSGLAAVRKAFAADPADLF